MGSEYLKLGSKIMLSNNYLNEHSGMECLSKSILDSLNTSSIFRTTSLNVCGLYLWKHKYLSRIGALLRYLQISVDATKK